jgi:hypothetical protein
MCQLSLFPSPFLLTYPLSHPWKLSLLRHITLEEIFSSHGKSLFLSLSHQNKISFLATKGDSPCHCITWNFILLQHITWIFSSCDPSHCTKFFSFSFIEKFYFFLPSSSIPLSWLQRCFHLQCIMPKKIVVCYVAPRKLWCVMDELMNHNSSIKWVMIYVTRRVPFVHALFFYNIGPWV